jgi:hypothetical protein
MTKIYKSVIMRSITIGFTATLLFVLTLTCPSLLAQNEPKTLVGDGEGWISGFGGPFIEFSEIGNELSIGSGGGGAVLFSNMLYVGGYGVGYVRNSQNLNNQSVKIEMSHGGLWLGYIHRPENLIHGAFSTKFGWGETTVMDEFNVRLSGSDIFVIQPQLEVEMNLTLWFKINAGLGYRWTSGLDDPLLTDSDINGVNGTLTFIFGWFKPYRM